MDNGNGRFIVFFFRKHLRSSPAGPDLHAPRLPALESRKRKVSFETLLQENSTERVLSTPTNHKRRKILPPLNLSSSSHSNLCVGRPRIRSHDPLIQSQREKKF